MVFIKQFAPGSNFLKGLSLLAIANKRPDNELPAYMMVHFVQAAQNSSSQMNFSRSARLLASLIPAKSKHHLAKMSSPHDMIMTIWQERWYSLTQHND